MRLEEPLSMSTRNPNVNFVWTGLQWRQSSPSASFKRSGRDDRKPLYIAFIDLTKAFDLLAGNCCSMSYGKYDVSWNNYTACMVRSFHIMKEAIKYTRPIHPNVSASNVVSIKQSFLFGITVEESLWNSIRLEEFVRIQGYKRQSVQHQRLWAKKNIHKNIIRDMLFANNAASTHTSRNTYSAWWKDPPKHAETWGLPSA